jgi:hypothetical protein
MSILGGRFYNHDTRTIFFKAVIRCDVARHSIGHKLDSRALTVETHKITLFDAIATSVLQRFSSFSRVG